MDAAEAFAAERPRLVTLAARVLRDPTEAEDVAQQAWLRLNGTSESIANVPAWLTTVTVRLCLDRLKSRTPVPVHDDLLHDRLGGETDQGRSADPAAHSVLADTVAVALHVVLDRLTPSERVAFVLHESFGFEFPMIADLLETSPAAARKLASRARAKVAAPMAQDQLADWEVVDAFLAAARGGDLQRLLQLLAPDVLVIGDSAAAALGTPSRIEGRAEVAAFFNGAAASALPVYVDDRPGAAWFDRGTARVAFDFTVVDGRVTQIVFRADPAVIDAVRRRRAGLPR